MTTEEKARAYEEAISKAKQLLRTSVAYDRFTIEKIFPELKESEDERVRRALIRFHKSTIDIDGIKGADIVAWLEKQGEIDKMSYEIAEKEKREFVGDGFIECHADLQDFKEGETYWLEYVGNDNYNVRSDNLLGKTYHITPCQLYTIFKKLTWLEKQGEQKSVDKIEQKFKVGDWITNKSHDICLITDIDLENGYYICESNRFGNTDGDIDLTDKTFHLWAIADAKNGDVLHSTGFHNDCIFIFKGLDNWKFDEPNGDRAVATGYCCLFVSADKMGFGIQGPDCIEVNTVKPATKIQRDLLFQKMHEAGYEWGAEKKESKKIEQNVGWSEEDETSIAINNPEAYIIGFADGKAHAEEEMAIARLEKQGKQKPIEWSEEDEKNWQGVIDEIEANKSNAPDYDIATYDRFLNWLRTLKQRLA